MCALALAAKPNTCWKTHVACWAYQGLLTSQECLSSMTFCTPCWTACRTKSVEVIFMYWSINVVASVVARNSVATWASQTRQILQWSTADTNTQRTKYWINSLTLWYKVLFHPIWSSFRTSRLHTFPQEWIWVHVSTWHQHASHQIRSHSNHRDPPKILPKTLWLVVSFSYAHDHTEPLLRKQHCDLPKMCSIICSLRCKINHYRSLPTPLHMLYELLLICHYPYPRRHHAHSSKTSGQGIRMLSV